MAKSNKKNKKRQEQMRNEDMAAMGIRGFKKQRNKSSRRREAARFIN